MRQQLSVKVLSFSETIISHTSFEKRGKNSMNSSETFSCSGQGESCLFLTEKTASLDQTVSMSTLINTCLSSSICLFGAKKI